MIQIENKNRSDHYNHKKYSGMAFLAGMTLD